MTRYPSLLNALTILFDGRPVKMDNNHDAVISSDHGGHHVVLTTSLQEIEQMGEEAYRSQIVAPVVNNLDGASFPERHKRYMDATREQMQHLNKALAG